MANIIPPTGQFIVPADEHESRIDRALIRQVGAEQRTLIMRLIRKGNIRINGKRCKPNDHVKTGDSIFIPMSLRQSAPTDEHDATISPHQLRQVENIPILFEDDWLLVLDKPAGMVVHGGSGHDAGLIEALKEARNLPELRLAHRLDRDTSGVLLLAKSLEALRQLTESFRERDMDKTYLAWISGHPEPHAARMTSHLSKGVTMGGERMVVHDVDGKLSITDYQVVLQAASTHTDYALVALKPHSGRTHQLRVQLQQEGHAILGDPKYASKEELAAFKGLGGKGLMLHAWRLRLLHPITQQLLCFTASLPQRLTRFYRT